MPFKNWSHGPFVRHFLYLAFRKSLDTPFQTPLMDTSPSHSLTDRVSQALFFNLFSSLGYSLLFPRWPTAILALNTSYKLVTSIFKSPTLPLLWIPDLQIWSSKYDRHLILNITKIKIKLSISPQICSFCGVFCHRKWNQDTDNYLRKQTHKQTNLRIIFYFIFAYLTSSPSANSINCIFKL